MYKRQVDTLPKIKLEILTDDSETVIKVISESANTGKIGDGKIFITNVEDVIRIRTSETGSEAI